MTTLEIVIAIFLSILGSLFWVSTVFLSEEKLIDELANALNALFEEFVENREINRADSIKPALKFLLKYVLLPFVLFFILLMLTSVSLFFYLLNL